MTEITRRKFLKKGALWLAGAGASFYMPGVVNAFEISNPKCRDDLYKDSDEILLARMIFGEARECPLEEMAWVGHTPFNRINDGKKYNGEGSLKDVLLKRNSKGIDQYKCFNDNPNNKGMHENFKKILNPSKYEPDKWKESLAISRNLMNGYLDDKNYEQQIYVAKYTIAEMQEENNMPKWLQRSIAIATPRNFQHQFYREPSA